MARPHANAWAGITTVFSQSVARLSEQDAAAEPRAGLSFATTVSPPRRQSADRDGAEPGRIFAICAAGADAVLRGHVVICVQ